MTVDSTTTAVQAVPVVAMEEAEVHREEVAVVDRDNTFNDVSSVSVVWSDYSFVLLRIERIFSIKTSQKRKKD